jgi:hypothetical protein
VEQELGRPQSGVERVGDETLREGVDGALGEVREGTVLETVRDTVTGDNLLSDTGDHLGDVDLGTCERGKEKKEEGR